MSAFLMIQFAFQFRRVWLGITSSSDSRAQWSGTSDGADRSSIDPTFGSFSSHPAWNEKDSVSQQEDKMQKKIIYFSLTCKDGF